MDVFPPAGSQDYGAHTLPASPGDWQTWTPTVAATAGAITAYTINSARYAVYGKMVVVHVAVTIDNNGTGAGAVTITLPFTAVVNGGVLAGSERAVTGTMLQGHCSSTTCNVTTYNNLYPAAATYKLVLSGVYEAV